MTQQPRRPTTTRRIHFYRSRLVDPQHNALFEPAVISRLLEDLTFDNGNRYMTTPEGGDLCVWPEPPGRRVRLSMGNIRRDRLPMIEDVGRILDLPISQRQGLVEQIHVVFFPDDIVGAEFNFYGPRLPRLAEYLSEKLPNDCPKVSFDVLLRRDALEQHNNFRDLTFVQIAVHRSNADLLAEADENLPDAISATAESNGVARIELILRTEPYSREGLGPRAPQFVRTLLGRPETRDAAEIFKVRGHSRYTSRVEELDLLRDQLVSTREVVRQSGRSRSVDSEAMFQAIEQAYMELREPLRTAAGLS